MLYYISFYVSCIVFRSITYYTVLSYTIFHFILFTYVYAYVCMYVYVYVYVYMYTCVCIYIYMSEYEHVHMHCISGVPYLQPTEKGLCCFSEGKNVFQHHVPIRLV